MTEHESTGCPGCSCCSPDVLDVVEHHLKRADMDALLLAFVSLIIACVMLAFWIEATHG